VSINAKSQRHILITDKKKHDVLISRQTVPRGDPLSSKSNIRGLSQQNPQTPAAPEKMHIRHYA